MGRNVNDAKITTRAGRDKLEVSKAPHWRALDQGAHLGYRKGRSGGSWIVRHRRRDGRYITGKIGKADDELPADGQIVLDYSQAVAMTREWCENQALHETGRRNIDYTVRDAIDDYLAWYQSHRKAYTEVKRRADVDVLPTLGDFKVSELDPATIRKWHEDMASAPRRARGRKGHAGTPLAPPKTDEERRKRKATANKTLTVLKAALNRAYNEGMAQTDNAWRRVKPFKNVDAPTIRYLTNDECVRLANACEEDFRRLVTAALYTGCRYSELTALICSDFDSDNGTLLIRESKSGHPRHVTLSDDGTEIFDRITAGRASSDRILTRQDGGVWGKSHQQRPLRTACKHASIEPAISFHILRHTHASQLATKGVPITVIAAQLGHSDTRITERHYAHLSPSYIAQTIRENLPRLGIELTNSNIRRLPTVQRDHES
tara:strand:+ start:3350 stop:4648 length:1299 start_codon:yes stop_codon:yes gene_type:complete